MLNIAIIGAGAISGEHIEAYLAFPERCKIVAVVDIDREKARSKAAKYKLDASVYEHHSDALQHVHIDVVSVCLPPFAHATVTIDCLNAGAHVLVEKPMAPSLQECDDMIAAAKRNKKILSPVAQMRFMEVPHRVKNLLDMKKTGRLLHVQTNAFYWRGKNYYDLDWRGLWETEGGGCTLNHAVHYIDLMLWMAGKPCEVSAFMTNQYHDNSEVEDLSTAMLRYSDGALGQITSSLIHHGEKQAIIFQTERAGISLPFAVSCCKPIENGFPESNAELEKEISALYERMPALKYTGHTGQIDNVIQTIEGNTPLLISAEDGRNTMELITAIYNSAVINAPIRLPLVHSSEFYMSGGIIKNAPRYFKKTRSISEFSVNKITVRRDDLDGNISKS
jgi:UDP-N-acetyl-2-amino-2-deoxyglucuronate dehydrogenase